MLDREDRQRNRSENAMHFIILTVTILLLSGCQTSGKAERDTAKILESQKNIVVSYLNSGLPSQAHGELRKILEKNPDDADFLELMGVTQLALKNPTKAVFYLRKSYQQSGKVKTGLNLSSALIAARSWSQAQRLILALLKESSTGGYSRTERLYHNLGLIYQERSNHTQAERHYRKALAENPSYYLTLLQLGLLYRQQQRYEDALVWLHKARNFCRKCLEPVRHLSYIYVRLGKRRRAFVTVDTYSRQTGLNLQERQAALALRQRLQKK